MSSRRVVARSARLVRLPGAAAGIAANAAMIGSAHPGRLSQLKRGCGVRRSRFKAKHGMRVSTGWGILTYNLDTLAIRTS